MKRPPEQALPVVRAAELDITPPGQSWLIESLWARGGVGLIGGTPKSLKTWLGLEIAVSVATGTPCLQQYPVQQPGPALIYLAEDRLSAARERLEALCAHRGRGLDTLDLHVITASSLQLDVESDIARLDATLAAHQPRLLLLDPFVRLHRSDESSAQDVAGILASLRELQRKHDAAIVVTHHTRKNHRAAQHGQTLRGSGDFHAWADSALYLTHHAQALKLTIEHRAAPAAEPRHVQLTGDPPHLSLVQIDPEATKPGLDDRVLETLRRSPGPVRRSKLRSLLTVNNARLGEALQELERLGRIHRTPLGWAC